jgi:flagellar biosynthesis protein FlhG
MDYNQPDVRQPEASDQETSLKKSVFAVASGKGGTGKSTFAINFALSLAALGHEVILVDADLGGADLSTLLGITMPRYTLKDFIQGDVTYLPEILESTPSPRLRLICGGTDIVSVSNPFYQQKLKLIRAISQLKADHIVVDLGPDITFNNLDFFNSAPSGFLVTQNMDAMILGFYRFLKAAFVRRLKQEFRDDAYILGIINDFQNRGWSHARRDLVGSIRAASREAHARLESVLATFQPKLVFNMVESSAARKTADQMFSFILENFGFRLQTAGFIPRDRDVERAYARNEPYVLRYPRCNASRGLFEVMAACNLNATPEGVRVARFSDYLAYLKAEAPNWQFVRI